jgi:hypothetical protein
VPGKCTTVLRDKSAILCTCCKKAGIWVYEVL